MKETWETLKSDITCSKCGSFIMYKDMFVLFTNPLKKRVSCASCGHVVTTDISETIYSYIDKSKIKPLF